MPADERADYLLEGTRTQPLGAIEAKRFPIDPHGGKPQARENARPRQLPADAAVDKAIIEGAAKPNF